MDVDEDDLEMPSESHASSHRIKSQTKRAIKQKVLRCPDILNSIKCLRVRCYLDKLSSGASVRLRWTGWLLAATIFRLQEPDIQLESMLQLDHWGSLPPVVQLYLYEQNQTTLSGLEAIKYDYPSTRPRFRLQQAIFFTEIKPKYLHRIPIWPVVLGIVAGLLILVALCGICRICGLFRRTKIPQSDRFVQKRSDYEPGKQTSSNQEKVE